jgi:D-alanine-D-alanine ligase
MHIAILHNRDHELLPDDPGREAREDVERVATAMAQALSARGRTIDLVPVDDDFLLAHERLIENRPDVVVNLCESLVADSRGEMVLPSLLELLRIPYTGSDALALGLALHKNTAKELVRAAGIATPDFVLVDTEATLRSVSLTYPLIVKPAREDASIGIDFDSVVHSPTALEKAVTRVWRTFGQPALVERYIAGREVYVPLLGNRPRKALPLTEIQFGAAFVGKPNIVSYRAKWETESPECEDSEPVRAELPAALEQRCIDVAQHAFSAIGCRDYGRVDLRIDVHGQPFVIDVNPNCDLHPLAGFTRAAQHTGLSYADLAMHLVELALERNHGNQAPRAAGPATSRRAAQPHRDIYPGRSSVRARAHRRRAPAE